MMGLAVMITDLDMTGYAESLQEQFAVRPVFQEYYEPQVRIKIPYTINLGYQQPTRHLGLEEQQVLTRALRRSVRVVHKAG